MGQINSRERGSEFPREIFQIIREFAAGKLVFIPPCSCRPTAWGFECGRYEIIFSYDHTKYHPYAILHKEPRWWGLGCEGFKKHFFPLRNMFIEICLSESSIILPQRTWRPRYLEYCKFRKGWELSILDFVTIPFYHYKLVRPLAIDNKLFIWILMSSGKIDLFSDRDESKSTKRRICKLLESHVELIFIEK